jgi:hypothetical protein
MSIPRNVSVFQLMASFVLLNGQSSTHLSNVLIQYMFHREGHNSRSHVLSRCAGRPCRYYANCFFNTVE